MSASLHGQQRADADAADSEERLVLLVTGRMLTGQVSRNAGGYLIEQPNGRVQIPADEVKFVVKDLHEAYLKQRDSIVEPTPATHVALANWCISHRLHDEARDELKKCLKSDPDNSEARRLLQRLTDTIREGLPPKMDEAALRKTADGFIQPEVESLAGLSRETASQFTSRVQPLLLNKCGNASCHGASTSNAFRLTLSRGAGKGTRQNTEHNLSEALRYVDVDEVASSQLLRVSQGAHGGKGTIFVGPAGANQIQLLRNWAQSVAQEKRTEAKKLEDRPRLASKSHSKRFVTQASAEMEGDGKSFGRHAVATPETGEETLTEVVNSSKPGELKADPTDAVELAREPEDPFDPDQFNRRFRRP